MIAWSYTALTGFEACPRRHHETRVAKRVKEPETEAIRWGNAVHKALEARAKDGTPLPAGMGHWEPMMARLTSLPGWTLAETQFALDESRKLTSWFNKDVWLRCVIDFGKLREEKKTLLALDYKTGKVGEIDQLMLFAAVLMEVYPVLDRVITGYVFLKTADVKQESFTRADVPAIWERFLPRVAKLEEAHATQTWPPKPSGLCKGWCPVKTCEFWRG